MPELVKLALILCVVCLLSAGALGYTYSYTSPIRIKYEAEKAAKARLQVMPEGTDEVDGEKNAMVLDLSGLPVKDFNALKDVLTDAQEASHSLRVYRGYDIDGGARRLTGYAVLMGSTGFSSEIKLMVGLAPRESKLTVAGTKVLSQSETPGLGAEMQTVSYEDALTLAEKAIPAFQKQFVNKTLANLYLTKDSKEGTIDAITASTISSRAFLKAVRAAIDLLEKRDRLGKKDEKKGASR